MDYLLEHWSAIALGVGLLLVLLSYKLVLWLFGVIIVPDDSLGVVTKKFVLFGASRSLPAGSIIALEGEAGYQADTLPPGMHVALWPWQYTVELVKFFNVPPGKIGVVEACDGQALPSGHIIARQVACDTFQDARAFLKSGGMRGPQMAVMPQGTYRINSLLFTVKLTDATTSPVDA